MKRSEAATYARWSAATALLLAAVTTGFYLNRKWVAHREKEKAPPPAPQDVTRLSSGLTFSKVEGNQKVFTVEAKKATDYKDKSASLMEDVAITIFGRTGARHDIIHTQSCQYEKDGASIVCSGEVQLELQSAANAERAAQNNGVIAQKIHVQTRGVTFSRTTGVAQSDQPVTFVFPNGHGEAVGVEYHSEEGAVRLLRDVSFTLTPANPSPQKKNREVGVREPVRITGKSADFERDSRVMRLQGPVEARTATVSLRAGELKLALDKEFHTEKLTATAGGTGKNPELESRRSDGQAKLSGQMLTAFFAPEGWLTRVETAGNVQGSQQTATEANDFAAENASLELYPRVTQPKVLRLNGEVQLESREQKNGEWKTLQTNALLVEFAEGQRGESAKPQRAETLGKGTLEWNDPVLRQGSPATPAESAFVRTRLAGDKLELRFGAGGKTNRLSAAGNVRTQRTLPGKPLQTATAQNGSAQLLEGGGWSQMELQGGVNLTEGDKNGQADNAVFVRSAQTATLTGNATVRDSTTETRAPRIIFAQNAGEIRAEGGVRSTDFSAKGSGLQLAGTPANISADKLLANSKTSRALYTGNARLWQGDSVMEADSIELLRETRILNAMGSVRAVFPQTPAQTQTPPLARQQSAPAKTKLWHVTAGSLTYNDANGTARLEKNVIAKSTEQEMRAPVADLYFTRNDNAAAIQPNPATPRKALAGAQQISRAAGTGGVTVLQGTRRASAERGEYSAADGKFVMSGGQPTIFDATEGTTTGRQLTFFLADDTIIVDSENGSRTLTKHRVEK